jgi:hypothetical protein
MNFILNNPVTIKNIKIAQQIFELDIGSDIGSLKGKTTRRKHLLVINGYIKLPVELFAKQQNIVLCIDSIKVHGLVFLTTISKNLYYRTAQYIESKSFVSLQTSNQGNYFNIQQSWILNYQNSRGQWISTAKDTIFDDFGINMNFANPQEHVPEAERNNRVIKERVRATSHRLPYKQITKTITKILVMEAAKRLNFFPAKQGISQHYSPKMILCQKHLDYTTNCKYTFGTYIQAHNEPNPKNDLSAQTLDCIYLQCKD